MTDLGLALVLFLAFAVMPLLRWANAPRFIITAVAIVTVALAVAFIFNWFHIPVPAQFGEPVKIVTILLAIFGAGREAFVGLGRHMRQRSEEIARNERSS